jgi:ketosteroid isomerase-like protein
MPTPTSPQAVFERFLAGIGAGRWEELADLYAEDAFADQPLAAPRPVRIAGRETIRAHFAAAATSPFRIRPHNLVVHTTGDPEVVIAEFDYEVTHTPTGRVSTMANMQLMRVRDGQIIETHDFHDHLRFAALAGRAEQLGAAMDTAVSNP